MTYDHKLADKRAIKLGKKEISITLLELDLSEVTEEEQAEKVLEEWNEFCVAHVNRLNTDHIAEEWFDNMQAGIGYLKKMGVNVELANKRHLEKLRGRIERRNKDDS